MNRVGLAARVGYAVVALGLVGGTVFYAALWLMPTWDKILFGREPAAEEIFVASLGAASAAAFTAVMVALTLPWKRRRRRPGRGLRVAASSVLVVIASLAFAGQGHSIVYDLGFAVWLAYTMAFTFVRYGVLDRSERRSTSYEGPRGTDAVG